MQERLAAMVPLKVNAEEGEGVELRRRYGITGFPTMVFADAAGNEVDRIVGYLPPDQFLAELERILAGDTAAALITRLDEQPGNLEYLRPAVRSLLDRGEATAALERLAAFRSASPESADAAADLEFEALWLLQRNLYSQAERALLRDEGTVPPVPEAARASALAALLSNPEVPERPAEEVAVALHTARFDDAGALLGDVAPDQLEPEQQLKLAEAAFSAGHYQLAADLWTRWYERVGEEANPGVLNSVAWSLYLARERLEAATQMARQAYEADPSPGVGDTLARLLYARGQVEEAIEVQSKAAAEAEGREAEDYAEVVEKMKAGELLQDQPSFETWPRVPEAKADDAAA